MISWLERAKAHFSKKRQQPTDETDKTPLSSVLSVPPAPVFKKHASNDSDEAALLEALLAEADGGCDHWEGGPEARQQRRDDVMAVAKDQWRDLLDHFRRAYPKR